MNKCVYLGMSVLDISKTLKYEFWCDYIKPKYGDRLSKIILHWWFDTYNYDENDERLLPVGKNKKVIGLFKDGN